MLSANRRRGSRFDSHPLGFAIWPLFVRLLPAPRQSVQQVKWGPAVSRMEPRKAAAQSDEGFVSGDPAAKPHRPPRLADEQLARLGLGDSVSRAVAQDLDLPGLGVARPPLPWVSLARYRPGVDAHRVAVERRQDRCVVIRGSVQARNGMSSVEIVKRDQTDEIGVRSSDHESLRATDSVCVLFCADHPFGSVRRFGIAYLQMFLSTLWTARTCPASADRRNHCQRYRA